MHCTKNTFQWWNCVCICCIDTPPAATAAYVALPACITVYVLRICSVLGTFAWVSARSKYNSVLGTVFAPCLYLLPCRLLQVIVFCTRHFARVDRYICTVCLLCTVHVVYCICSVFALVWGWNNRNCICCVLCICSVLRICFVLCICLYLLCICSSMGKEQIQFKTVLGTVFAPCLYFNCFHSIY